MGRIIAAIDMGRIMGMIGTILSRNLPAAATLAATAIPIATAILIITAITITIIITITIGDGIIEKGEITSHIRPSRDFVNKFISLIYY